MEETVVNWYGVADALRTRGTAVHIGARRGWSACVREGEHIVCEGVHARVARRLHAVKYDDFPEQWRKENTGDVIDDATASNYGLYAVRLFRA